MHLLLGFTALDVWGGREKGVKRSHLQSSEQLINGLYLIKEPSPKRDILLALLQGSAICF